MRNELLRLARLYRSRTNLTTGLLRNGGPGRLDRLSYRRGTLCRPDRFRDRAEIIALDRAHETGFDLTNVRYLGQFGEHTLILSFTARDPKQTPNGLEGRTRGRSGGCFLETDGSTALHTRFYFGKLFATKAVARW